MNCSRFTGRRRGGQHLRMSVALRCHAVGVDVTKLGDNIFGQDITPARCGYAD